MRLPDWLGFRGKTLWDWLQLLVVPAILIGVTFVWSATQTRSDNKREDRRIAADRAAAEEAPPDATLQSYLDQMSGLMLHEKLLTSKPGDGGQGGRAYRHPHRPSALGRGAKRPRSYASCIEAGSWELPLSTRCGPRSHYRSCP